MQGAAPPPHGGAVQLAAVLATPGSLAPGLPRSLVYGDIRVPTRGIDSYLLYSIFIFNHFSTPDLELVWTFLHFLIEKNLYYSYLVTSSTSETTP